MASFTTFSLPPAAGGRLGSWTPRVHSSSSSSSSSSAARRIKNRHQPAHASLLSHPLPSSCTLSMPFPSAAQGFWRTGTARCVALCCTGSDAWAQDASTQEPSAQQLQQQQVAAPGEEYVVVNTYHLVAVPQPREVSPRCLPS